MKSSSGVIGVGSMGGAIAKNLLKAGHTVSVFDKRKTVAEALTTQGARTVSSPREMGRDAEVIITMLPSGDAVSEVASGPDGFLNTMKKGGIFIDLSTIEPDVIMKLALEAGKHGINVVDGAVYGIPSVAEAGRLVIMLAGEDAVLNRCQDILQTIGKTLIRVGQVGNAKKYKLAGNMLIAFEILAASEVVTWMRKAEIDPAMFLKIFEESFDNREMVQRINTIRKGGFRSDPSWIHKDLTLGLKVAEQLGLPMPMAALGRQLFLAARALEGADTGVKGICRVYETLNNIRLSDKAE
ncbi:MAG: NAD(P)-dependent oxidoreductase [Thaumarchaeota archaeon]|nr:NAD(P)-dependent oxidoreductase [Nitrososphaerota archaeon]